MTLCSPSFNVSTVYIFCFPCFITTSFSPSLSLPRSFNRVISSLLHLLLPSILCQTQWKISGGWCWTITAHPLLCSMMWILHRWGQLDGWIDGWMDDDWHIYLLFTCPRVNYGNKTCCCRKVINTRMVWWWGPTWRAVTVNTPELIIFRYPKCYFSSCTTAVCQFEQFLSY